jgi:uncharacterized protein (TIGR02145 family)
MTSDEAIKIGNLANASHILTGKITKTPKTFMLELAVTDVETGERKASHSPKAVTPDAMENLSALKEASADLLKQLGVSLTDSQIEELRGPVAVAQVQAQTALAHGVVAQRQGTSVAALSYYYQAAAFDPTLAEAVKRSSVMSANISGTNLGDNIRNDIVWRKKWVEQLKDTEETFSKIINSADPPYTLYYSTAIETKNINYQTETADLNISLNLTANTAWFKAMQRTLKAAKAVMDGLNATNRKKDWGLDGWPRQGVSSANPFAEKKQYYIPVEFELVNQQGRVIGRQTARLNPYFSISNEFNKFNVIFAPSSSRILAFNAVKADEISDNLTIRITSVNGKPPKTAKFSITTVSTKEFPKYQARRAAFTDSSDGKKYETVEIGAQTWMAENLNYEAEGSKCYDNEPAYQKYGRLYDWHTAMKACPKGWHLPSDREWRILEDFADGGEIAGKKLKARNGWNDYNGESSNNGTDDYGFSALPGGGGVDLSYFGDVGKDGCWWSATEHDKYYDYAWYRRMYYNSTDVSRSYKGKGNGCSVRCVQD